LHMNPYTLARIPPTGFIAARRWRRYRQNS
jgi:hypothetical protein